MGAPPRPTGETLGNVWFCLAIGLVLIFCLATQVIEKSVATGMTDMSTHIFDPERPHPAPMASGAGLSAGDAATMAAKYQAVMDAMHRPMMEGMADPDPEAAFVRGMIPHHQGRGHGAHRARIRCRSGFARARQHIITD